MSTLTFAEKGKFERYLDMKTGWVLNFTDREFADLVSTSTGISIFDVRYAYRTGSKANRLRSFWVQEDDHQVAKLMRAILDCMDRKSAAKEQCVRIIERLEAAPSTPQSSAPSKAAPSSISKMSTELLELKEQLDSLATLDDRNKAGLALELLLNKLFEVYDLAPRKPFRVAGEQIDGSFHFENNTYLLEAKWTRDPLPVSELYSFQAKLDGKARYARGLFISLNGVSEAAEDAITRGKSASFVGMNGYDLRMILSEAMSLTEFLHKRVRLFAEDGRVFVPFSDVRES